MTAIRSEPFSPHAATTVESSLAALVAESLAHPAVNHPFLARFAAGNFRDPAAVLYQYAQEYSGYSAWFPSYLETVIERLPEQRHRDLLLQHLEEEKGQLGDDHCAALRAVGIHPATVMGVPHPVLFRRFCEAVGVTDQELAQATPAAASWRTRFLRYLRTATAAEAVGALGLGTGHVVKPIYRQLLAGIVGLGTLRRDQFVFFELHVLVDDQPQLDLLPIAAELAARPGGLAGLRTGMRTALRLRGEFWDHLYNRAFCAPLANPA